MIRNLLSICLAVAVTACGGGGGGNAAPSGKTAKALAQICAAENVLALGALEPTFTGSLADERNWIKAYMDERYLWYRQMATIDAHAANYNRKDQGSDWLNFASSIEAYFYDLLSPERTASFSRVDQFSFITDTASWQDTVSGSERGYGWILQEQGNGASRQIKVAYVYPTTDPNLAFQKGVLRGDEIIRINRSAVNSTLTSDLSAIDSALSPSDNTSHSFELRGQNGRIKTLTLKAQNVVLPQAEHRVVTDTSQVKWGYLLFNSHVISAQEPLLAALRDFKDQNVSQLVVDLRYNGGGYLAMASSLAYGVAGAGKTQNKNFERLRYSDKRSAENSDMPFFSTDFDGRPLAALNLSKIHVLTSRDTCSASESFINGLRGVDVEVVQIGGKTCGKPYGFMAQDNCGITYAAMEFEGVNHKGEGGYAEGIPAQCAASDDLTHALGDPAEAMFAVALAHQKGLACVSPTASSALATQSLLGLGRRDVRVMRPEWHSNKLLRPGQTQNAP